MDNDILIDEARRLYHVLSVQYALSVSDKARLDRLERLIGRAYCRYYRRFFTRWKNVL
jgi:hypothetical protein